jgi:tripartite-type tricarboxylate transporter receptor subunit TctC
MKLPHRRQFLRLAAGAATLTALSRIAWAQTYPARPVHLIVPFPAGGTTDILARLMGQWLSERLGQQFIIENRPGAGTNIGTEAAVNAPPDGYTLLLISPPAAINATLYERLNFNLIRDVVPVAGIIWAPLVMTVNPLFPARTVPEFVSYAKANPGKINMASSGNGSGPHVAGELFKMMTGVNMIHVPYRGESVAFPDLLGGQVQVLFGGLPGSIEFIRTGRLRALGVTTATRSEAVPDIPSIAEFVPGYEAVYWTGVVAPKKTPVEIVDRLNKEINAGLANPRIKAQIADQGGTVLPGSPADFGMLIADETEKWGKVVKFSGARVQ